MVAVFAFSAPVHAGGWTQEPGDYYVKIWGRSLLGTGVFGPALGEIDQLEERYQDHQLQSYGELGVTERLTWVGYAVPVGHARYGDQGNTYVGPLSTGVRVQLFRSDALALSAQAMLGGRVPFGEKALFEGEVNGQQMVVRPTLATGQADAELQLGIARPKGWMSFHAGARGFTGDHYLPAVTGYAQFGWTPKDHLVFDLHLPIYRSFGAIDEVDVLGVTNTSYLGFGLSGSVWLSEHLAVTGSFEGAALAVSNAATPSLNLGIELR
ncbi:MAG: hypothetical protein ACI9VR_002682 [Cognaticolwellia sp.]|jgi:hypothetical protein